MKLTDSLMKQIHPVYESYLHFYSAISYEVLGEVAHKYSKNKLPLLCAALESFVACSAALPATTPVPDLVEVEDPAPSPEATRDPSTSSDSGLSEWSSTGESSLLSSITRIIDSSIESLEEDDPFISKNEDCTDPLPFKLPRCDTEKAHLMPSPLQIRKSSSEFETVHLSPFEAVEVAKTEPAACANQKGRVRLPPPLPIKIVQTGEGTGCIPRQTKDTDELLNLAPRSNSALANKLETMEKTIFSHNQAIMRYNNDIQFLRARVGSSIGEMQVLIDEVTEIQRTRRLSKTVRRSVSFWSFSPVKDQYCQGEDSPMKSLGSRLETKEQRIARLRAEGWKTVGLKSARGWKGEEYYRRYCSAVLDEMYCSG